jgi:hypothetical protein
MRRSGKSKKTIGPTKRARSGFARQRADLEALVSEMSKGDVADLLGVSERAVELWQAGGAFSAMAAAS